MAARTRFFELTSSNTSEDFTIAANRSERVEAAQCTTSATQGTKIRLSMTRSGTVYQIAHDIFVPPEKFLEPLFRGLVFEAGDRFHFDFAPGAVQSTTWLILTTDEQTV